ncbi:MAG: hybrid sensor histidine kinase/response regulator [Nitrospinae bacterium]|nr:hybrid sensor histidine kinase/response regulator [Nitrospinota bacterium]
MFAIKFTKAGESITLFCPEARPGTVAVRDTGVGIPPEVQADLFRHEVKTTTVGTGGEGGTGLGLPYCAEIMKAHGGSLTVESEVGNGATFYATLPEIRALVLMVDDVHAQRMLMREQFRHMGGVDIIEAESGDQALALMRDVNPHLIITDLVMPGMDGFTLIETVRKSPVHKGIPILAVTSGASGSMSDDVNMRQRAFALGADDFVTKPVIPSEFLPRISRFLGFS